MRVDGAWKRGGIALAALIAGLAAAHAGSLKIESWRNDDADIWNCKIIPAFNKHYPDIKVEFAPLGAEGIQRRAQRAPRRRSRGRSHRLPAVRRLARSLQQAPARRSQRPQGHGQFLRRRQIRLDDRRRQDDVLRADGFGHPRLHLQQGRLRQSRRDRAEDDERIPRVLDKLKKDGTYTPIVLGTADQWEAATMGFQNIGPDYWDGETGRVWR